MFRHFDTMHDCGTDTQNCHAIASCFTDQNDVEVYFEV